MTQTYRPNTSNNNNIRTLIIRSSEWHRGQGSFRSYLKTDSDGKFCCLGLDAKDCGVEESLLVRAPTPSDLPDANVYLSHWVQAGANNSEAVLAMKINDDPTIDDETRISLLRPIFREAGIEIDWRPNE